MYFIRFNFLFVILILQSNIFASELKFTTDQCLNSNFEITVEHNAALFGVIKKRLEIKKDKCQIEFFHKRFIPSKWVVDVCREPIHLKLLNKGEVEVVKRIDSCLANENEDKFCKEALSLLGFIQDDGLIFATGARELLTTDHGKIWCSYLLLKRYVLDATIFSAIASNETINLFENESIKNEKNCDIPIKSNDKVKTDSPTVPVITIPEPATTPEGQF
jgi:hypothetical protein